MVYLFNNGQKWKMDGPAHTQNPDMGKHSVCTAHETDHMLRCVRICVSDKWAHGAIRLDGADHLFGKQRIPNSWLLQFKVTVLTICLTWHAWFRSVEEDVVHLKAENCIQGSHNSNYTLSTGGDLIQSFLQTKVYYRSFWPSATKNKYLNRTNVEVSHRELLDYP